MLNIQNLKHNKEAFTLVEVMLLLVVLSLVFASSVSLITRKHKLKPRRSVHGQYICFREPETGVLRQVKYSGKSLLQDQREIDKCTFEAPSNSSYMYIMLVGAGGAGGNANHKAKTADLYEGPKYIDFLKNLNYGKDDGSNEVAGINDDDVTGKNTINASDKVEKSQSPAWRYEPKDADGNVIESDAKTVLFSVLAFRKILRDNNVKIFAYDYAGDGDSGGSMQYNLFSRNSNDPEKDHWYNSICEEGGSGANRTAKECLERLMDFKKDEIYGNTCVLRSPIYQNCPLLLKYFTPTSGLVAHGEAKREGVLLDRPQGEPGAIIFTKERDFDTNISYANGKRYKTPLINDGKVVEDNIIDWGYYPLLNAHIHANNCILGVRRKKDTNITYNPGTFMTYDEALESLDITKYNDGKALNAGNKDRDGYVYTGYDNGEYLWTRKDNGWVNKHITQRVFKTYPSIKNIADIEYELFTQWGSNSGVTCESQTDGKIVGETNAKNGGLPFFDGGGEGVKICVGTNCKYEAFASYKGGTSYSSNTAGGKSAAGVPLDNSFFDATSFTYKTISESYGREQLPKIEDLPSTKTRTLPEFDASKVGDSHGNPFFSCVGRVGFSYSNSSITKGDGDKYSAYSYLLRIPKKENRINYWPFFDGLYDDNSYNSYNCPAVKSLSEDEVRDASIGFYQGYSDRDLTENSIGFKISHYISRSVLHHGEHGTAGESKTLFARSFGTADITMLPGLEGKKKDIVTATDATDEDRTASAGNGQSSTFGIGCQTQDDGELKCDYKLVAKGGAGGAGYIEETPDFVALDKAEIYNYAKGVKTTAPDKYSDSYVDGSYEGEDSDFQQIAYLSDFPGTDARDIIKKLGKGGDGGYVHHKCWLQPQYFKYHYNNWVFVGDYKSGKFGKEGYTFTDWVKEKSDFGVAIPNVEGRYGTGIGANYEGYTAFTEDIIKRIGVCGANGKEPQDQFDEIQGTDGYPGAIVIMW